MNGTHRLHLATAALPLALVLVGGAAPATGQQPTNASLLVTDEALDVGGKVVPPGTYRFEVLPLNENRNLLQLRSEDGMELITTVLSVPHQTPAAQLEPEATFVTYGSSAGGPKVLRTWFEKDRSIGHDIVYPKARAMELAALNGQPVPATPEGTKEGEYASAPIAPVAPEQPAETSASMAPPPASEEPVQIAEGGMSEDRAESAGEDELPRTASRVPLLALAGALALGGAGALHALRGRAA